ncbi:MAG: hypothetical protein ACMG57_00525 [Candidatus Dojkabacteria bacterium]
MFRNFKTLVSEQFTALSRITLPRLTAEATAIYRSFPMYLPGLPDVNTSANIVNDTSQVISYRGAYFLLYMEGVGKLVKYAKYRGSVLNRDSVEEVLNKLEGSGINIVEDLEVLKKWIKHDDSELLKAYLSLLLKIQALDTTLKVGIELSGSRSTETEQ